MLEMRKMKDSGIEWIGEIPEGWEVGQIGQLYSERRTKVSDKDYPPLSVTMKGILPQLSTAAKTDAHDDRKLVCKGDFAINSRSDRRGSCGISEQDGSISLINTVLKPRGEMNPGYYNWLFHTSLFADEFYKCGHGIVDDLWTTGWSDMKKIGVPVPSKCEQKQLAEHLNVECSHIDSILSKTCSSIEEYKKLKQSVITQAVTKTIYDDFGNPSKFRKLRSLCDVLSKGTTPKDIETQNDEFYCIRYLKSENIVSNQLNLNPTFFITAETNNSLERSKLNSGDILFVIAGASIGKVAITTADFLPANTNQAVAFIRLSSSYQYATKYIWYFLQSDVVKQLIALSAVQSAQPNLSLEDLGAMRLPLPDQMGCLKITDYLDAKCAEIDGLIVKKEQLVKELESYKKSLIYEVVTGKREV